MKKLLAVLFALSLVVAFAMPASAADVKASGAYWIQGSLQDNPSMQDGDATDSASSQWTMQQFRAQVDFQVVKGLMLSTRMDIMERYWGESNTAATTRDNEVNIEFDRVYITANVGPGVLKAGYQDNDYGLGFGNNYDSQPLVKYEIPFGKFVGELRWQSVYEGDVGATVASKSVDEYAVGLKYKLDKGFVGVYNIYQANDSDLNDAGTGAEVGEKWTNEIKPYFMYAFGPVTLQGELSYQWGEKDLVGSTRDYKGLAYQVQADAKFGAIAVGGEFLFSEGDDPNTVDVESGTGLGLSPLGALIMFDYWVNKFNGVSKWGSGIGKSNVAAMDVYASYQVSPKLNLRAQFSYADADVKANSGVGSIDTDMGTELDLTATYKIYDNLSYMVGFGYLWTGDYWKTATTSKIDNDYLITNKLTLVF